MPTLVITIILAVAVIFIALILLSISWLLTGKSKLQPGACGRAPHQKRNADGSCSSSASCQLCEHPQNDCHDNGKTISGDNDDGKVQ